MGVFHSPLNFLYGLSSCDKYIYRVAVRLLEEFVVTCNQSGKLKLMVIMSFYLPPPFFPQCHGFGLDLSCKQSLPFSAISPSPFHIMENERNIWKKNYQTIMCLCLMYNLTFFNFWEFIRNVSHLSPASCGFLRNCNIFDLRQVREQGVGAWFEAMPPLLDTQQKG